MQRLYYPNVDILLQKGIDLMAHDGYRYLFERRGAHSKKIWRCVEYTTQRCPGRAHSRGERVVHTSNNHNHQPKSRQIVGRKVVNAVKEIGTARTDAQQDMMVDAVNVLPASVADVALSSVVI